MRRMMANLEKSLAANPRAVYVLYHNPLLAHLIAGSSAFAWLGGTEQYSIYSARSGGQTG